MEEHIELLECFDGSVWAQSFIEVIRSKPEIEIDKDFMEVWFCNALMVGYDRGKKVGQIVRLTSCDENRLGGWENNELAEIVKYESSNVIVVRLLDAFLSKGFVQEDAKQRGYPYGHLVVSVNNILFPY